MRYRVFVHRLLVLEVEALVKMLKGVMATAAIFLRFNFFPSVVLSTFVVIRQDLVRLCNLNKLRPSITKLC